MVWLALRSRSALVIVLPVCFPQISPGMIGFNEGRNVTLDVAKGISILLMTVTHLAIFNNHPAIKAFNNEVLLLFKMPLFIFVSGYQFSGKRSFKEFARGKFDGLVKPVVTILFISASITGIWWLAGGESAYSLFGHVRLSLSRYYIPLWFPVTLFLALIVFRFVLWAIGKGKGYLLPTCVGLVLVLAVAARSGAAFTFSSSTLYCIFWSFLQRGILSGKVKCSGVC